MAIIGIRSETEKSTATGEAHSDQAPEAPFHESDRRLARQKYAMLYYQVRQKHVSFDQIARAWHIRNNPAKRVGGEEQRASEFLEYLARRQFAAEHGGIRKDYWSKKPWAGCALTGDGWLHSVLNSLDEELVLYDSRIHQLCRDAHRTFEAAARRSKTGEDGQHTFAHIFRRHKAERDLKESGEMLYSVLTRVIGTASVLEDKHATLQQKEEALDAVRVEWKIVSASVEEMIQRQARFEYFEGVGLGALITIPALGVAGWVAAHYGTNHFSEPGSFTAAIIGGAAGAVISVTQRMTANTLVIDFAAPKYQKIALGALRPIVGAIFGAVVYFAIIGGLLAVEARTGNDTSIELAFFAVAGFAAGFSERFATDVLDSVSRGILPTTRGQQGVKKPDEVSLLLAEQTRQAGTPTVTQNSHRTSPHPKSRGLSPGHSRRASKAATRDGHPAEAAKTRQKTNRAAPRQPRAKEQHTRGEAEPPPREPATQLPASGQEEPQASPPQTQS